MAFNTHLADRITDELNAKNIQFEELKMFGGLCYMVDEKMCIGIIGDDLMARVDPDKMDDLLNVAGADHMMFTGRRMKSFITVSAEAIESETGLDFGFRNAWNTIRKPKNRKRRKNQAVNKNLVRSAFTAVSPRFQTIACHQVLTKLQSDKGTELHRNASDQLSSFSSI